MHYFKVRVTNINDLLISQSKISFQEITLRGCE